MSFKSRARAKVLEMAEELSEEARKIGVVRSVDATETSQWLKELSEHLWDACLEDVRNEKHDEG